MRDLDAAYEALAAERTEEDDAWDRAVRARSRLVFLNDEGE